MISSLPGVHLKKVMLLKLLPLWKAFCLGHKSLVVLRLFAETTLDVIVPKKMELGLLIRDIPN